jgi:hypothetical protein
MRSSSWLAAVAALSSVIAPGVVRAQTLNPFSDVKSVCSKNCTGGPEYDRIVLKDGTEVRARTVSENDRFVVLEKFGELRAVGRDQIQTLDKNPKAERGNYPDAILTKDGSVLAGRLKSAQDDVDPFELTSGAGFNETAWKSVIVAVYRGGKLVYGK